MPVAEFQDAALLAIKGVLPFDSSMWGSATMSAQGIDIHTLHLHETSMQMIEEYAQVKHLDQFAHEVTAKEKHTIRFSAQNAQAPAHRKFLYKYQHLHGLITQNINPQTRFVQWLSLFRRDPDRSPETTRNHGKSIYKKLGTTKVTQLSALLAQRE